MSPFLPLFLGDMSHGSLSAARRPGPGGFAASDFELRSCEVPSCQENQATDSATSIDPRHQSSSIINSEKWCKKIFHCRWWQVSIKGISHLVVSYPMLPPVKRGSNRWKLRITTSPGGWYIIITSRLAVIYHSSTQVYRQAFIDFNAADHRLPDLPLDRWFCPPIWWAWIPPCGMPWLVRTARNVHRRVFYPLL